jgi:hypothetical protein
MQKVSSCAIQDLNMGRSIKHDSFDPSNHNMVMFFLMLLVAKVLIMFNVIDDMFENLNFNKRVCKQCVFIEKSLMTTS